MTTSTYSDDFWEYAEWQEDTPDAPWAYAEGAYDVQPAGATVQTMVLLLAALTALGLVVGLTLLVQGEGETAATSTAVTSAPISADATVIEVAPQNGTGDFVALDADAFAAPYDEYILTQGIHGLSYGHMAIDIAAGKDAPIKSPIYGVVTERYVDPIGNPVLVIENTRYAVTMLHGNYTVQLGDEIALGQIVGAESNRGNTRDMQGRSCRNRDCGYHTHLNVFDKERGRNLNPLALLGD